MRLNRNTVVSSFVICGWTGRKLLGIDFPRTFGGIHAYQRTHSHTYSHQHTCKHPYRSALAVRTITSLYSDELCLDVQVGNGGGEPLATIAGRLELDFCAISNSSIKCIWSLWSLEEHRYRTIGRRSINCSKGNSYIDLVTCARHVPKNHVSNAPHSLWVEYRAQRLLFCWDSCPIVRLHIKLANLGKAPLTEMKNSWVALKITFTGPRMVSLWIVIKLMVIPRNSMR